MADFGICYRLPESCGSACAVWVSDYVWEFAVCVVVSENPLKQAVTPSAVEFSDDVVYGYVRAYVHACVCVSV